MTMVLAFDTALGACSAALWRDGAVPARRLVEMTRGHAEALMPMVRSVIDDAGIAYDDLDAIAVTIGPGAFTGLRIGLAAARGMALAARLPVVGVTTLEALAHATGPDERVGRQVLAVIDSRRAGVYAQLFSHDLEPQGEPEICAPDALAARFAGAALVLCGDGAALLRDPLRELGAQTILPDASPWPDAAIVAAIAAGRLPVEAGAPPPSPLYLRPPEAKLPKGGGRLRP